MMIDRVRGVVHWSVAAAVAVAAGLILGPEALSAQAEAGAREMRHFWHVFVAYAVAWLLILGWIVAIWRRLGRLEDQLRS